MELQEQERREELSKKQASQKKEAEEARLHENLNQAAQQAKRERRHQSADVSKKKSTSRKTSSHSAGYTRNKTNASNNSMSQSSKHSHNRSQTSDTMTITKRRGSYPTTPPYESPKPVISEFSKSKMNSQSSSTILSSPSPSFRQNRKPPKSQYRSSQKKGSVERSFKHV